MKVVLINCPVSSGRSLNRSALSCFSVVGLAAVGLVAALLYKLSLVVDDILKDDQFKDLDDRWGEAKRTYAKDCNIPRQNKKVIADWARRNLSRSGARAVLAALEKSTSGSRSTARVKGLTSRDITELLDSLLALVAADFTVFEILIGALKETDDPGRAVRKIARQMEGHQKELQRKLGKS